MLDLGTARYADSKGSRRIGDDFTPDYAAPEQWDDGPQGPWTESATGPAEIETFYVDPSGSWWVTVRGGAISRSDDQGNSWIDVYVPPVDS